MAAFGWDEEIDATTRLAILDSLLGEAPIGIGILDTGLRYRAVNAFLADTNGVPVEGHVGRTVEEVLGEAGAAIEPVLRGVLDTGTPFVAPDVEVATPAAPDVLRRFATSFHALRVDGETVGVIGVVVERTESGAAVDVLRSSERRYRSLVEATSSLVWQVHPGEESHDAWLAAIHPEDRERMTDAWTASVASLSVFDQECRIETSRGLRHVSVRAVPIVESGVLREWVGASTDITTTRAAQEALRDSEARLRVAVESGGMGTFDHDFRTGKVEWSAQTAAIFGMTLDDFDGEWTSFVSSVHPDDVREIEAQLAEVVPDLGAFQAEMRTWRDGGWNGRVLAHGQVIAGPDGGPSRMIGMVVDVTQQRRQSERVSEILESIADAFYALDREWRFTYVNHEAASLLRRPAEELLGRSIWEEFPEARGTAFEESYRRAAEGELVAFQAYYPPLDGWFDLRAFHSPSGISVYFRNIDDERAAEEERRSLEDQRAAAAARTARLGHVASALTEALSEADVSRLVLEHACDAVGARGGAVAVFDADGSVLRWSAVAGYTPEQQEQLWQSPLDVERPLTRVVRTRLPEYLSTPEDLAREFPAVSDVFTSLGDVALCSVPLVAGGRCLGGMTLTFATARPFLEEERLLLSALADTSAQALERARLYEREHRVAETLQRALLPDRLARPAAVDSAARYLPGTEGVAVGGDWYDVFDLGQNRLGIALGDVVGKGVAAAAVMGRLRNALRAFATSIDGPAEVLTRVDDFIDRFSSDDLATLVYGVLDVGTGELRFSSAGHLPPLLVDAEGIAGYLPQEPDVPVGVTSEDGRTEHRVRLTAGDTLVLYSDGLVEDRTRSIDEGLAELAAVGADTAGEHDVEALCGRILERLVGSTGGADDVALLAMRWAGPPASDRCSAVLPPEVASSRRARALLAEELERWGEAELTEIAALCMSEIVTNAVVHAGTPVHLDIVLQPDRVRVEVADGGAAPPERVEAEPEAVHGRGIAIVEMLSAGWGVEQRDEGKCVWFELERSS